MKVARARHHGEFRDTARGTNVQSSAPEVRDIIERGVADAVRSVGIAVLFGIDKVTKYHMEARST